MHPDPYRPPAAHLLPDMFNGCFQHLGCAAAWVVLWFGETGEWRVDQVQALTLMLDVPVAASRWQNTHHGIAKRTGGDAEHSGASNFRTVLQDGPTGALRLAQYCALPHRECQRIVCCGAVPHKPRPQQFLRTRSVPCADE